ncbi:MAG: ATP-binding cassette domain-containing protein [Granulosicoccus sp.]|nr:ATP-binding cassette domain-containing protein [Granulosicoccus sp.]
MPLVDVRDLCCEFDVSSPWLNRIIEGESKQYLRAVNQVSFQIAKGETLALVGESGSGKSTIANMLVGLLKPTSGQVHFDGQLMRTTESADMQALRKRVQMIFQSPYASLNPRWKVGDIISEPLSVMKILHDDREMRSRVDELLLQVGLSPSDASRFPHEFSGGQRQRIAIARALSSQPEFIVCDEPTSALDVSVQAQILNLMRDLQDELGLTYLFISHDLSVVRHMANRIGVLYLGALVEMADSHQLFTTPAHPYTRMLLDAVPDLDMSAQGQRHVQGEIPNPINPPSGCSYHPRCQFASERCSSEVPQLVSRLSSAESASVAACHGVEEQRIDPVSA